MSTIAIIACLSVAVLLAVICSTFLALLKNPMDRLQYSAVVTTISATLIMIAIWLGDSDWQSRLKTLLTCGILFLMNGVLSHATARAIRVHELGRWHLNDRDVIDVRES